MTRANGTAAEDQAAPPRGEDFAELLEQSLSGHESFEGRVIKGTVISVDNDMVLIDVGLKSEGRVPLKDFATPGQDADIKAGVHVDVFVER